MASTKKSDSSSTKMTLKLLVDKSRNRVLFAEAGKDFVDFLFGLLQLPVGAILGLLAEHGTATDWSIAKVYESVESMDSNYMQPNQSKISLLSPKCRHSNTKQTPMLQQFVCTVRDSRTTHLPACSASSLFGAPSFGGSSPFEFSPFGVAAPSRETTSVVDGYVKAMVTYMVMDDLTVKPMSTISSITVLNTFQVRDVGCLEEKITQIDWKTASKLVKASFESSTVLTDVFLKAEAQISLMHSSKPM